MFAQQIFNDQENLEGIFNSADFPPSFLPGIPLENLGDFFFRDDPSFYVPPPDFDFTEHGFPFMIDSAMYQYFQEDFKKFIPGFEMLPGLVRDSSVPEVKSPVIIPKSLSSFAPGEKIGTISAAERRLKVQRFLEKRKRRIFKKRISYVCRKRVADSRVRVKGRFITKEEALKLTEKKD